MQYKGINIVEYQAEQVKLRVVIEYRLRELSNNDCNEIKLER